MAKVMICDDAAFMRMMIKDILTKNGYEIAAEAENGQKAVEKYPEAKPDLVLMDITMPEMDGIEALKKIKALDPGAKLLCVLQWDSRLWLSKQSRQEQKTLSSNHSRQSVFLKQ